MSAATTAQDIAIGIVAGLAAAFAMTKFQAGWSAAKQKLEPDQSQQGGDAKQEKKNEAEPATAKVADWALKEATGKPVPGPYKSAAGAAVHYGFGAFLGGLYGAIGSAWPQVRFGFGTAFGAAVWATADEALVPAAGLSKPPQAYPLSEHLTALASHLAFGAFLEGARRLIDRGLRAAQEPQGQQG